MTLVAGVDIGNSTTEIVVQEGGVPLAWRRRPTRGAKGSPGAVRAAAALLRAIEKENGIRVARVVVAPWRPVTTECASVAEAPPDTGRIRIVDCSSHSVAGDGAVAGTPWNIAGAPPQAPALVAVVPPAIAFREAVARIGEAAARGHPVAAVLAARDEAVLIASRLALKVPVVDGVDTSAALACGRLLVETRAPGACVSAASDVWALRSMLQVGEAHADALALVARWVRDARAAVIGLLAEEPPPPAARSPRCSVTWRDGEACDLFDAVERLQGLAVGAVRGYAIPEPRTTGDLWGVDVTRVLAERGVHSPGRSRDVVLASLAGEYANAPVDLEDVFGVPVEVAASEALAASMGARTTPGLNARALVLDIGGGTIDLVGDDGTTAAGGGELLTAAVSRVLGVPLGAADWIKRGPARRVESPGVLMSEDGSRHFVAGGESPLSPRLVGSLVTAGPSGYASFGSRLQPAEWRIIRQSLKLEVIARNVGRVIRDHIDRNASDGRCDVVVVGGPAGDDELLPAIGRLDNVSAYGRGNVAGRLGHRYAVAYGLTLSAGRLTPR